MYRCRRSLLSSRMEELGGHSRGWRLVSTLTGPRCAQRRLNSQQSCSTRGRQSKRVRNSLGHIGLIWWPSYKIIASAWNVSFSQQLFCYVSINVNRNIIEWYHGLSLNWLLVNLIVFVMIDHAFFMHELLQDFYPQVIQKLQYIFWLWFYMCTERKIEIDMNISLRN